MKLEKVEFRRFFADFSPIFADFSPIFRRFFADFSFSLFFSKKIIGKNHELRQISMTQHFSVFKLETA
jgi:hypothetical protein